MRLMPEKSKARMVDGEKERPKPDKLPDFWYRAGAGLTISYGLEVTHEVITEC